MAAVVWVSAWRIMRPWGCFATLPIFFDLCSRSVHARTADWSPCRQVPGPVSSAIRTRCSSDVPMEHNGTVWKSKVLRFANLNGRAQNSGRDTRRLVSVRSLKAASLASALTNFLREGRRESCMHARTPPSRLFSLHTCRLCACACVCVSAFTRVTSPRRRHGSQSW